ncbi:MAG: conjugative transposon protein TraM [Chryseobacterium sp.]|nr:MAG: conjugative transposon protein TraM [Chryseobacterium sp.]
MGGGKNADQQILVKGINTTLPGANFKSEDPTDKMAIYKQRERDSSETSNSVSLIADKLGFNSVDPDRQTKAIEEKLAALNREIAKPEERVSSSAINRNIQVSGMKSDVDRLELLMKNMQSGKEEDPEMKQLSGMLEKVLDIQHPQRVRESYIRQVTGEVDAEFDAIPAIIVDKQKVMQGTTLKLRLKDSVTISGVRFVPGQEVSGIVNLTNQRLLLDIKTIRVGKKIIPVDLSVYGLDGIKGINAPDAIVQSAISGGADDALRSVQLLGMDASIGTQVAGAGIDAAKGLFSKKVRRLRVKLPAGYPVLLRINKH